MKMYESSTFETDTESGFSDAFENPQTDMLRQKRLAQILNSKHKIDYRLREFLGIPVKEENSLNNEFIESANDIKQINSNFKHNR